MNKNSNTKKNTLRLASTVLLAFTISIVLRSQTPISEVLQQNDSIPFTRLEAIEFSPLPYDTLAHPYLFTAKNTLEELQNRVKHPMLYDQWQSILDDALKPSNYRWKYANGILSGGMGYQITGERRYADSAMVLLRRMLDESYNWTAAGSSTTDIKYMNYNISDKALSLAYAFDYLQDVMTIKEKEACIYALQKRIYPAYIKAHYHHNKEKGEFSDRYGHSDWWTNCYFNWNSSINGSIGLAAIASLWEIPESRMVLQLARVSLKYTHKEFNQKNECGGYDEGVSTYYKHIAYLSRFYAALNSVFQETDGFFELPGVEKSIQFGIDFISPDGKYVPFSASPLIKLADIPSEMYYLANIYKRRDLSNHIDKYVLNKSFSHFAILWRPLYNDTITYPNYPNISCYKDINWGVFYAKKMYIPFKGGDNAANNTSLNAGELLLWQDNTIVLSTNCNKKETRFHNCLVLNGKSQLHAATSLRNNGEHSENNAILSTCHKDEDIYQASIELTSCYDSTKTYNRYILLDGNGYFFVLDEVETTEPSSMELNWHYSGDIKKLSDSSFIIKNKGADMLVYSISNIDITCTNKDTARQQYIHISSIDKGRKALFLSAFAPCKCGIEELVMTKNKDNICIRYVKKGKQNKHIFYLENGKYIYRKQEVAE